VCPDQKLAARRLKKRLCDGQTLFGKFQHREYLLVCHPREPTQKIVFGRSLFEILQDFVAIERLYSRVDLAYPFFRDPAPLALKGGIGDRQISRRRCILPLLPLLTFI
jgi:hypothetical protein